MDSCLHIIVFSTDCNALKTFNDILENNPELVLKSSSSNLNNIIDVHKHAANVYVPKKKKTKHKAPWVSQDIINQRNNIKQLRKEYNQTNEQIQLDELKTAQNNLHNMYIDNQINYIIEKTMEIQRATEESKSRIAWRVLNKITG